MNILKNAKNAASLQKMACSITFGTPGETRTHYLTLRRRTLCPGELRRLGYCSILADFRIYVKEETAKNQNSLFTSFPFSDIIN